MNNVIYSQDLCIFFPTTLKEYENKSLEKSLDKLISTTPSSQYSFDLFLFFDQHSSDNYKRLSKYSHSKFINNLQIHVLNIPENDNLYYQPWQGKNNEPKITPRLGFSSGPAVSFFESLYYLIKNFPKHKNFLLLEADVQIVQEYWFDKLSTFAINTDFSIAGSKYKGTQKWHRLLEYKDHLNGIAIYKNTPDLLKILKSSEDHMASVVALGNPAINFDVAIDEWRREKSPPGFFNKSNQFLNIKYITNASDEQDGSVSKATFLKYYPDTLILHHKTSTNNFSFELTGSQNKQTSFGPILNFAKNYFQPSDQKLGIPLFFHIPKHAGTAMLGLMSCFYRYYHETQMPCDIFKTTRISVIKDGGYIYSLFCYCREKDLKDFLSDDLIVYESPSHYEIDFKNVSSDFLDRISTFSIFVYPGGARMTESLSSFFDSDFYYFMPFTVLRDPFEKALSVFEYQGDVSSDNAKQAFSDFISGIQQEDSWFLRNILDLPQFFEINDNIFNIFKQVIKNFKFMTIESDSGQTLNLFKQVSKIYKKLYNLEWNDIPSEWFNEMVQINENKNKSNFKKEDINQDTLNLFHITTEFDYKLYNKFRKKIN